MFRFRPSLLFARRHATTIVALLLAAQLSLFAHAVGHDYGRDVDQSHVVCGLCIAAHHFDHGLPPAAIELPQARCAILAAPSLTLLNILCSSAPFQARAPPVSLPT